MLTKSLGLRPYQKLFFTGIAYDDLQQFDGTQKRALSSLTTDEHIILLSGIASPKQIIKDLSGFTDNITALTYPDHHQFSAKDLAKINKTFEQTDGKKLIVTTEKDATSLRNLE